jgi:hypothetical protein
MLQVMNAAWDAGDQNGALKAAIAAAPYIHPRLSSICWGGTFPVLDKLAEGVAQSVAEEECEGATSH